MPESAIPAYITSLIRHFEDLRDGCAAQKPRRHHAAILWSRYS